jgi:hypothetical protein
MMQHCMNSPRMSMQLSWCVILNDVCHIEYIFYLSFHIDRSILLILYTDTPYLLLDNAANNQMIANWTKMVVDQCIIKSLST